MDDVLAVLEIGGARVEAVVGDLTEQRVDAIVNAANTALAHGGGVAGAIVRKGGREIQAESDRLAPIRVGEAVATGAGRLPCRHVIHTVGPRWGDGDEEATLRRAITSALALARRLGVASLAVPAVSTGIYGVPREIGCRVIAATVADELSRERTSLRLVRLIGLDRATAESFRDALTAVGKK